MNTVGKATFTAAAGLAVALLGSGMAAGRQLDEYGQQLAQTVARVSVVKGNVSYARGDDPENWQAAEVNIPVTLGDHLYTGQKSRLELQVHGGDVVRLGAGTDLTALNLTEDTRQFAVKLGVATFEVRRLDQAEVWEVDTPNSAVTLEEPGRYTVIVDRDGNSRISVRSGAASVAAGGGQVPVSAGQVMRIDGIDSPRFDVESIGAADGWDRWNQQREDRLIHSRSSQYVSQDIVGGDDLDQYGQWQQVPDYGWAWTPASVQAGWAPYRAGRWGWQDPWGWTWISSEPWGWAPYHYGRWVTHSSRWFWVPVAASVHVVAYSPALVAFVGDGPGFSHSVAIGGGGGFVGWFPLGPRDPLNAWWLPERENVNVTNVTYVNKTYVTVVNQNTFVSGGIVTNNIVRDKTVTRQIAAAPVVRGALPVIPTTASMRSSARSAPAARPPAAVDSRAVVARVAPPPAPPRFDQKLAVIRQNGGAPVAPRAAAQLTVQQGGQLRSVTGVRPAAAPQSGGVTLAPARQSAAAASRVQPVEPVKGRPLATADHPVSAEPVTGGRSGAGVPAAEHQSQPAREQPARKPVPAEHGVQPTPGVPAVERQSQPAREQPARKPVPAEHGVQPTPGVPAVERQSQPAREQPARKPVSVEHGDQPTPGAPAVERQAQPAQEQPARKPVPAERGVQAPTGLGREAAPEHRRTATPPNGRDGRQPTPARTVAAPDSHPPAERIQGGRPVATPAGRSPHAAPPEARPESSARQPAHAAPAPRGAEQTENQRAHEKVSSGKEQQKKSKPTPTPTPRPK